MLKQLFSLILTSLSILLCTPNVSLKESKSQDFDKQMSAYVDSEEVYSLARIYKDVGLPFANSFDGTGIKIGIIDREPSDYPDEDPVKINQHSINMKEIICGDFGIAPGADCYIVKKSRNGSPTLADCINNLIYNYHVNMIVCAIGLNDDGRYHQSTNYIDEQIFSSNVPFIYSSGNNSLETQFAVSNSLGLNVISVGAIDKNRNLSYITSYEYDDIYQDKILSPTLLAPGEKLFGFKQSDYTFVDNQFTLFEYDRDWPTLTGTSYSAPIVAGITALLMEEFPALKSDFGKVMTVLTTSCSMANQQTSMPDYNGFGFGIVNYSNARKAAQNMMSSYIADYANDDSVIYQSTVSIPIGSTLNVETFVKFNKHLSINNSYATYNDLSFSMVGIELIDIDSNSLIDWSYPTSNFTRLSFTNNSILTNFILLFRLIQKENYGFDEAFAASIFIQQQRHNNIEIIGGNYLDKTPLFSYNFESSPNCLFYQLAFFNFKKELVFRAGMELSSFGTIQLTSSQWDTLIAIQGREYYACIYAYNLPYVCSAKSEIFLFNEPDSFFDCLQILPKDWGFQQQYYFSPNQTTHSFLNSSFIVSASRLRCGYIENTYINLSPRRKNAGTAYLELIFNQPVYNWMIGVTLWAPGELYRGRDGDSALIQTFDQTNWTTDKDILQNNDIFGLLSRKQIIRFQGEGPIWGLRIYATSDAFGDKNRGRLCIDDIVLNLNNTFDGFSSNYYEVNVENKHFRFNGAS